MFESLLEPVLERAAALERYLALCELWDDACAASSGSLAREIARRHLSRPNAKEEKVFRHCTVIVQLYALYESFCRDIVSAWLERLPSYRKFPELPESLRNAYRLGIGRLIQDISSRRYRHLEEEDVLLKYYTSISGSDSWEFVSEALTRNDQNLRRDSFEQLFGSVDLRDIWGLLERSEGVKSVTTEGPLNQSLEQVILNLVSYRNDAAHGQPDEILGAEVLREWIYFVLGFCVALSECVSHRIIGEEVRARPDSAIGEVTETFKDNVAVIVLDRARVGVTVGERLYFFRGTDCVSARVLSIQVENIDCLGVSVVDGGLEVGLRTSEPVQERAKVIVMTD